MRCSASKGSVWLSGIFNSPLDKCVFEEFINYNMRASDPLFSET